MVFLSGKIIMFWWLSVEIPYRYLVDVDDILCW